MCSSGGDGGNRTPVRKHFNRNFSGRRRSFAFPRPTAGRHAVGLGSFIMRGTLKALRTHVHHSSTPHPGSWSSRVERSLIMQREEQYYRRSLIYKRLPVLWMSGASARYSCLHAPVETSTPPYMSALFNTVLHVQGFLSPAHNHRLGADNPVRPFQAPDTRRQRSRP